MEWFPIVRLTKTRLLGARQGIAAAARRAVCGLISLLVIAVSGEAYAGGNIYVWDGGANNGNWGSAANWDVTPTWDNQANLQFAGSVQTSATNNITTTIRNMTFNAGAGAFTISGSAVSVGNAAGFVNSSSNLQTINLAGITLTANTNFNAGAAGMSISSPISGAFNFLIPATSTGTLSLSGSNSFTGAVTMSAGAGALRISSSNALGTTAGGVTITTGGALELTNNITVGAEALSLIGTGISSGGAVRNISGTNTYGGLITLAGAARINSDAGLLRLDVATGNAIAGTADNLTFGGAGNIEVNDGITNTTATLTKDGAGTLTLAASNTYSGLTTISNGWIRVTTSTNALGQGTLTIGGGNLEIANDTPLALNRNTTLTASGTIRSDRTSAGAGVTHTLGTLSIGAQTLTLDTDATTVTSGTAGLTFGAVTLSANNASFVASAGTQLTLGGFTGSFGFSVGGAGATTITGIIGTTTGTLSKTGSGKLTLSAANTYTGLTTISGGTLAYGIANALNTGGITLTGGATLDLATFSDSVGAVTLTSGNIIGSGTLTSTANFATTSGTIAAPLGGTGFGIAQGSGTTVVTSSNAFTGGSTVASGGVLNLRNAGALGTSGTATVSSGGAIELQNSGTLARVLSLSGSGVSSGGALRNVSGTNGISAGVTLAAASLITSDAGLLTLSGTIGGNFLKTFGGAGNLSATNVISGNAGMTMAGSGTLTLSGNNTVTNTFAINSGVVRATTSTGALGAGSLTLGGGALELANDTGLAFGRNVTVASSGTIFSERLTAGAGVTHTLGTLSIGGQTLTLATDASVTSGTAGLSFAGATLTGNATLSTGSATALNVTGAMSGGFGITKTGAGVLTLSDASGHGNTTVSEGRLNVNFLSALGTTTGTLSMAAGTTLGNTSGAAVTVGNAKSIVLGSSLTFAGPSDLNLGTGTTTLAAANTTIDVSAGTLTFGGNVVGDGLGITKTGTGTLVFTHLAAGAYTGNTTISQGELFLDGLSVLGGGTGTIVTVQNGAFLRIGSSASAGNVTVNTWTGGLITGTVTNVNVTFTTSGTLSATDAFLNGTQTIAPGIVVSASANYFGTIPSTPVPDRIVIQNSGTIQALASFDIEATQGVVLAGGTTTFNITGAGGQRLFVESVVSGSGTLRKTGTNNLRLLGENTYTGGTIVEQGIIGVVADASLGAVTGGVQILGGELVGAQTAAGAATDVTLAAARAVTIGNGVTSAISAQNGNRLAYAGTLAEVDGGGAAGNVRIGFAGSRAGTVVLGGTNTYRGSTTLVAGTLEVAVLGNGGAASGLGQSSNAAGNLVLQGGSLLRYTGADASTDRLFTVGTGGATIDSGTGRLAFTNSGTTAQAGTGARTVTLAGSGSASLAAILADLDAGNKTSLVKSGAGTWELTSAQLFTGTTSLQGGTLLVNALLESPVTTAAATTLGGSGTIGGFASIGGIHAPGNSPGLQTFSNGLTYGGTSQFQWELSANTAATGDRGTLYDGVDVTGGNLQIDAGATFDLIFNSALSGGGLSTVSWGDEFWAVNHEWVAIAFAGAGSSTGLFTIGTIGNDINGNPLWVTRPEAWFEVKRDGDNIIVAYSAPEPGSITIAAIGVGILGWRLRRRIRVSA